MQLTVAIPTHQRADQLGRCLDRLERQTIAPDSFEVLVAVDRPTTGHLAVVDRAIGNRMCEVRRVAASKPGASAARNACIKFARGEIILMINDDILAEPTLLSEHAVSHSQNPEEPVAVLGHVRWADELRRTSFMRWLERGAQAEYPPQPTIEAPWWWFFTTNVSVKRAFLERSGGFDENFFFMYQDTEMAYRLHRMGMRIMYNPAARAEHLHSPTVNEWRERVRRIGAAERRFIEKHPDAPALHRKRYEAALEAPHRRGVPGILFPLIPEWLPYFGSRAARRVDEWNWQRFAPDFFDGWDEPLVTAN